MDLPKLFTPKTKTNLVYYVKASAPVSPGVFCCFAVLFVNATAHNAPRQVLCPQV